MNTGKSRDLRLEASNLLSAIIEHDPFLSPQGRSALENANRALDEARDLESRITLPRNSDFTMAFRLGTDPETIPDVAGYIFMGGRGFPHCFGQFAICAGSGLGCWCCYKCKVENLRITRIRRMAAEVA